MRAPLRRACLRALVLLAVACGPAAERGVPAPPPTPEREPPLRDRPQRTPAGAATGSGARVHDTPESDGPDTTRVDPGKPPLVLLRYELVPGSTREFHVELRLALLDEQQAIGSLEVHAPLVIASEPDDAYAVSLKLGPARTLREGATDALGWGGGESRTEQHAQLSAHVTLHPSGAIATERVEAGASSALGLLYETLLNLDAPPSHAVGSGARWYTQRSQPGGGWTKTEYELVELEAKRATFRVQRKQVDGQTGANAVGEWTFSPDEWPPTGHDQLTAEVPESGSGARFSVRFAVTRVP